MKLEELFTKEEIEKLYIEYPPYKGKPPRAHNFKNLIDLQIGELTVLYRAENKGDKTCWHCLCSCGKHVNVLGHRLTASNPTRSCGHLIREATIKRNQEGLIDLTGKKFGKLTVVKRIEGQHTPWLCKCDCGREYVALSGNLRSGATKSCGQCTIASFGEEKIKDILNQNSIEYETQKKFDTCKRKVHLLPFDFYVKNTNCLIEYDGKQHYGIGGWNDQEGLKELKLNDDFKTQWCKENNIPLIRIPYTQYNDLKIEDLQLDTTSFRVV